MCIRRLLGKVNFHLIRGVLKYGYPLTKNNMNMSHIHTEQNLDKVEKLAAVANDENLTLSQLALAWILRQPNVSSALVGASHPEQLEENVKASGVKLAEDTLERIEGILNA